MSDNIANNIAYYVRELRDFPDGNIIQHITQLATQHASAAPQVVDAITSVLVDARTLPTYKKPLFYLIDSILKRVGGPYNHLFQQRFSAVFPIMIGNISPEDRKKLDFLFGTWGERNFFTADFLLGLKTQLVSLRSPILQNSGYQNNQYQQYQQPLINQSSGMSFQSSANSNVNMMVGAFASQTSGIPAKEEYEALVVVQMHRILLEIFAGIDTSSRMSLEELQQANPDLYRNIRVTAEGEAKKLWQQKINLPVDVSSNRMNQASQQQQQYFQQRGQAPSGHKRGIDDVYNGHEQQQRSRFSRPAASSGHQSAVEASLAPAVDVPNDIVKGFVAETPVLVDLTRARQIAESLGKLTQQAFAPKIPTVVLESLGLKLSQRLQHYVDNAMIPPPLPDILAQSNSLSGLENVHPNISDSIAAIPVRAQKPEFKLIDFDRFPDAKDRGVLILYAGEQFREDGLRFKTVTELRSYTDTFLEKKKLLMKKKDQRERLCREWNCTLDQWITNFGELKKVVLTNNSSNVNAVGISSTTNGATASSEEYIVPADEHFVRCPISHEVFQQDWDYEAGENIFHNAVRVLVTDAGDASIRKVAQPVYAESSNGPTLVTGIQYFIVHKPLVMDRWLNEGKAKTLLEVLQHLKEQQHSTFAIDLIDRLIQAAGDDDEEDVFVILDETMR